MQPEGSLPFKLPPSSPSAQPESVVRVSDLRKTDSNHAAFRGIQFSVQRGEMFGLIGPDGAGKTTTIKMLCGLLPPTAGSVNLAGTTENLRHSALRQRWGYLGQKFTLYDHLTIFMVVLWWYLRHSSSSAPQPHSPGPENL